MPMTVTDTHDPFYLNHWTIHRAESLYYPDWISITASEAGTLHIEYFLKLPKPVPQ